MAILVYYVFQINIHWLPESHSDPPLTLKDPDGSGLKDLREHVVFRTLWTPLDIARNTTPQRLDLRRCQRPLENLRLQSAEQSTLYPNSVLRPVAR